MTAELLAPAGDIESGFAAFEYGADAVYLGLGQFSARAEATNFTPAELNALCGFARTANKKVLVAVNTVIFDSELPALIETLSDVSDAKADGVIVQDWGVARIVKKYFPRLRLHASTQMAAHNKQGVEALRDFGFKRVVLARETSLEEIKRIKKDVPGIEIETFIHGALCYCYSGLCTFSATYTGRSANRGKCVYPCREEFLIEGLKKHPFSMKDLALGENVRELVNAGVNALKIEGRKKSPLYVAAVTDYYRSVLDGETNCDVLNEKLNNIRCIFSRPTTKLYLGGIKNRAEPVDPDIVGHRGLILGNIERIVTVNSKRAVRFKTARPISRYDGIQIDTEHSERPFGFSAERLIVSKKDVFEAKAGQTVDAVLPDAAPYLKEGAPVYLASSSAVKKAYPLKKIKYSDFDQKSPVDVVLYVNSDGICAAWNDVCVKAAMALSPAKNISEIEKSIRAAFEKTGGTALELCSLKIENPENLFVPISALNALRREFYEKVSDALNETRLKNRLKLKQEILSNEQIPETNVPSEPSYVIKTDDPTIFDNFTNEDLGKIKEVVFDISGDFSALPFDVSKIRLFMPAVVRKNEETALENAFKKAYDAGIRRFEIANVWGLSLLKKHPDCNFAFDWEIYAANIPAAKTLSEFSDGYFTVCTETDVPEKLYAAFPEKALAVIYQDMPLFVSETCPRAAAHGKCLNCGGNYQEIISSRYGKFLSVAKNCRQFLLNEKPVIRKNEAVKAGAKLMRLDFVYRKTTPEKALEIFRRLSA